MQARRPRNEQLRAARRASCAKKAVGVDPRHATPQPHPLGTQHRVLIDVDLVSLLRAPARDRTSWSAHAPRHARSSAVRFALGASGHTFRWGVSRSLLTALGITLSGTRACEPTPQRET